MDLKLQKPIAFFDLETTGINVVTDRIVEIAILKIDEKGVETEYHKKINPTIPIPPFVTEIHGISDDDVKDAPKFMDVAKDVHEFLVGCDLGGYNHAKFDIPLLLEEFLRCDIDFDLEGRNIVDAQIIFHKMEPRTLSAAYKMYCSQDLENAHSAMADTKATFEVVKAQIDKYNGMELVNNNARTIIENDMDSLGKMLPDKVIDSTGRIVLSKGIEVFGFGKHKNKPVKEVLKAEPGYYDWILRSEFSLQTKNALKKIKMNMLKDSF